MVQTSISAWLTKSKGAAQEIIPLSDHFTSVGSDHLKSTHQTAATSSQPRVSEEILAEDGAQDEASIITIRAKSFASKPLPIPPNVALATITPETLPAFRRMTTLLLPVPYADKFYKETVDDPVASNISLVALWSDPPAEQEIATRKPRIVSAIRCRLLACSPGAPLEVKKNCQSDPLPSLYISTVTTLAPFRGHGLASALLRRVTARAIRDYGVVTVTAHMWEANEEAREWYTKHDFREVGFEEHYYKRLKPSGAYILERKVRPQDLLNVEPDDSSSHV